MSGTIDLSQLPAPDVVEPLSYETLFEARKAALIALYPAEEREALAATLALDSEPLAKLLQENVYRELNLRQRINEAARGVMLAYAIGADLDQLAANYGVRRLTVTPADPRAIPPRDAVMEPDADFRGRIQRAFDGLSVAGPTAAYEFFGLSADGRVADISAHSPAPTCVTVAVLARAGNGTAPADLLAAVESALNAEDVRPVGDRLTVVSAEVITYRISATLYFYPGPESGPIMDAAREKLATYVSAQRRLGRDIRRSAIVAALHVEGVQRVELAEPVDDIVLSSTQAGYCVSYDIRAGGYDE